jgi:hypothetical protein
MRRDQIGAEQGGKWSLACDGGEGLRADELVRGLGHLNPYDGT